MILVDSSVWIDYFRGDETPQVNKLEELLSTQTLAIGDLILTEVLQGFSSDRDFNQAKRMMTSLEVMEIGGQAIAIKAARNFLRLRFFKEPLVLGPNGFDPEFNPKAARKLAGVPKTCFR